ncbi:MAG: Abi family protein [Propionicimonas sp.]|uniref:Abi family protein n=1 Tax=Propionicimonas sp. TaxID=1955623 RepID=UPI003D14467F
MSTPARPFLTLDERVDYLRRKNYLFDSIPSERAQERLAGVNFHYLLGYARNYRLLGSTGRVPTDDALDRVFDIVDADRELAISVFRGLRMLEWKLRALFVEHHCALFSPDACYLKANHYRVFKADLPPLAGILEKHIRRSREPYLVEHFANSDDAGALPVWAVVDTWSFGALSRVICETVPATCARQSDERRLWKEVATSLGVSATTVMGKLEAMTVLRNLVAHHSRLWMRPTAYTPKIPKVFPESLRSSVQPKSMYGAFLTLAEMLGPRDEGRALLAEIDKILSDNAAFRLGITHPIAKAS